MGDPLQRNPCRGCPVQALLGRVLVVGRSVGGQPAYLRCISAAVAMPPDTPQQNFINTNYGTTLNTVP